MAIDSARFKEAAGLQQALHLESFDSVIGAQEEGWAAAPSTGFLARCPPDTAPAPGRRIQRRASAEHREPPTPGRRPGSAPPAAAHAPAPGGVRRRRSVLPAPLWGVTGWDGPSEPGGGESGARS